MNDSPINLQINYMFKTVFTNFLIMIIDKTAILFNVSKSRVEKSVVNCSAGRLTNSLSLRELRTVTNLSITGEIDTRDFKTMRDKMPLLSDIDMSDVVICSYSDKQDNEIPHYAFCNWTNLTSIIMPNSVTRISVYAFSGCTNLSSITIPESVTSIGHKAFSGCTGLKTINYNAIRNTSDYTSKYSPFYNLFNVNVFNIGPKVEIIPAYFFEDCSSLTSIDIPNSVTSIGQSAFSGHSRLKYINIPVGVSYIGQSAFSGCSSLTSINIPADIHCIDNELFFGCTSLSTISIPETVRSIGDAAFSGCTGLTSINIPDTVRSIGDSAFANCSGLDSITIPEAVNSIGNAAFSGCTGLKTINYNAIKNTFTYSPDCTPAFQSLCNITTFNIGDKVQTIPAHLLDGCTNISSITIPDTVTSIGRLAFSECRNLDTVNYNAIKNTLNYSYGESPFHNLTNLTVVNIGEKVKSLSNYLFSDCTRIREINTLAIPPPSLDATTFNNVSKNIPVYLPASSRKDYVFDPYWSEFSRIYVKEGEDNTDYSDKKMVSIMTVGSGYVLKQLVNAGESVSFLIAPDNNFKIESLTVNGKNMLNSLDANGYLNLKSLTENKTIVISPENITSENIVSKADDNSIRSWSANGKLIIESNNEMTQVELLDHEGQLLETNQNLRFAYELNYPAESVNTIRVKLVSGELKTIKIELK